MSNLIELLKDQKRLEESQVKVLKSSVANIQNPLVAALVECIVFDSMKHAAICKALIDVNGGEVPSSMDIDMAVAVNIHQDIRQHVEAEAEMITGVGAMSRVAEDKRVKALLQYILDEEKRHHSTFLALSNLLDQNTAAFEEYLGLWQKYMITPS
jgi:hypothetical protein